MAVLPIVNDQAELAAWLGDKNNEGEVVQTRLAASDRVIARVTDGIYRQPASALRELISNAWDADASSVTVLTDAPRFSRIYVRDNGRGMSHQTLSRLLKNIGGSAKRRSDGAQLGITDQNNVDKTPSGRPLIGKIGIGLFSISQLSRRFQIVTKVKGEGYRLVAEIRLRAYSEDGENHVLAEDDDEYISGDVLIRRERAEDVNSHGTDIILDDVKPLVRDLLRSSERWVGALEREEALARQDYDTWAHMQVQRPTFHSGYIGAMRSVADAPTILQVPPHLPWSDDDPADRRMAKLMDAVEGEFSRLERPDLATTLDTYLEMIWSLGLSAPVPYVDKHPFDLSSDDNIQLYWVAKERGRGVALDLQNGETVRDAVQRRAPGNPVLVDGYDPVGKFDVNVDGVLLRRPIRFRHRAVDTRSLQRAILFVGQYEPDLSRMPPSQRGGSLALDAYLFWTGRVVPKENNGVLVRIRGASGSLFDPTFFKYQVSEQTRLRQITSEIFVHKGLDAALNIDRESFNFAHPHLQLLTLWLHGGIRQLTNRLKDEAQKVRSQRREAESVVEEEETFRQIRELWRSRKGDEPLPRIIIASSIDEAQEARVSGAIAIVRSSVPPPLPTAPRLDRDLQLAALAQTLAAYDVLEGRTYDEQQELMGAIMLLFGGGAA